jgi:hypothetical protein
MSIFLIDIFKHATFLPLATSPNGGPSAQSRAAGFGQRGSMQKVAVLRTNSVAEQESRLDGGSETVGAPTTAFEVPLQIFR